MLLYFFYAIIPTKALKEVEIKVKPEFKFMDPILGYLGIKTGIAYNYRLYGNFIPYFDEAGKRIYHKDKTANDPIWDLTRILFPSQSGQFSTSSRAISNFGKMIKNDPAVISDLLLYTKRIREKEAMAPSEWQASKAIVEEIKELEGKIKRKLLTGDIREEDLASANMLPKEGQTLEATIGQANSVREQTANKLLNAIKQGVKKELAFNYPKRTVEQMLLSFLWYHFNTTQELQSALVGLEPKMTEEKTEPSELEKYIIKMDSQGMTPYGSIEKPVSNGDCKSFNRAEDIIIKKEPPFADCVETTIRHLLTILFFDHRNSKYHLSSNKDLNAFFPLIENNANNGDENIRSAFNRVVGDLGPDVLYAEKNSNNLHPGMLNVAMVLNKIFNLALENQINDIERDDGNIDKVLDIYNLIFEKIQPMTNKKVKVEFLDSPSVEPNIGRASTDFFGRLKLTIEMGGEEKPVELIIFFMTGHAQIDSILDHNLRIEAPNTQEALSDVYESVFLLNKGTKDLVTQPLYRLFSQYLSDNDSKIKYLKQISQLEPINKLWYQYSLKNLLKNISYDDRATVEKFSSVIFDLIKLNNADINKIIYETVRGIYVGAPEHEMEKKSDIILSEQVEDMKAFENLEYIFGHNFSSEELDVSRFLNLIKIEFLIPCYLKKLILGNHPKLKALTLSTDSALDTLDLRNYPELEKISISDTNALILGEHPKLKELDLGWQVELADLDLRNYPELEKISISSFVQNLIFGNHQKLKELDLGSNVKLGNLDLQNCPELEKISISSPVENLILGLYPKLKELDLKGDFKLQELNLEGLNNFRKLNIDANINVLKLKNLPNLEQWDVEIVSEKIGQLIITPPLQAGTLSKLQEEFRTRLTVKNAED